MNVADNALTDGDDERSDASSYVSAASGSRVSSHSDRTPDGCACCHALTALDRDRGMDLVWDAAVRAFSARPCDCHDPDECSWFSDAVATFAARARSCYGAARRDDPRAVTTKRVHVGEEKIVARRAIARGVGQTDGLSGEPTGSGEPRSPEPGTASATRRAADKGSTIEQPPPPESGNHRDARGESMTTRRESLSSLSVEIASTALDCDRMTAESVDRLMTVALSMTCRRSARDSEVPLLMVREDVQLWGDTESADEPSRRQSSAESSNVEKTDETDTAVVIRTTTTTSTAAAVDPTARTFKGVRGESLPGDVAKPLGKKRKGCWKAVFRRLWCCCCRAARESGENDSARSARTPGRLETSLSPSTTTTVSGDGGPIREPNTGGGQDGGKDARSRVDTSSSSSSMSVEIASTALDCDRMTADSVNRLMAEALSMTCRRGARDSEVPLLMVREDVRLWDTESADEPSRQSSDDGETGEPSTSKRKGWKTFFGRLCGKK